MENFTFLKNDYPDLYLLCSDVAKYIDTDNSISMLKARQAIEFIVKYLGAETDDLFVNINNLEDKNIANSRIIELFHFIRKKANKSVHNEINSDTEGVLDALIEICVWLAVGNDKKNISIIKFTDKEKYFLKKYGKYDTDTFDEELDEVDTINPLEVVGKFSDEDIETTDVLEQDVFETYEEYCARIESLPPIKIGYAFLDPSQIDDYCEVAFPLFHVSRHPKIESVSVSAFYVSDIGKGKNIDGIIKAKLKIFEEKIYYDFNSVILQDEDSEINIFAICWDRYGYETEEQFAKRIKNLPLLPVGIAKPIRKEYDLRNKILPFEIIPLAYVSKLFSWRKFNCVINRDDAREVCLAKSYYRVYGYLKDLPNLYSFQILNQENNMVLFIEGAKTVKKSFDKAKFEIYQILAMQGNAEAQYGLARCYEYAYGIEEDEKAAFKWYKKSAENGYVVAQCKLGDCYDTGIGVVEDENKAFEWYRRAAEQGYAEAQFSVANCYFYGTGIEEDDNKAFEWYKISAENGYYEAMHELADCYSDGMGTNEDTQKASEWRNKVANINKPESIFNTVEREWVLKMAKQGHLKAQCRLADFYESLACYDDAFEVEKFKWFKKAAEQGHVDAQVNLALCYENGDGVEADEQKAFEWYKKAAERGNSDGQFFLARAFKGGMGTEKNEQKAFEWYKKAAEQGESMAQVIVAECYINGDGVEADEQKAFEWYKKAAEQGNDSAQYKIAERYELGTGTVKDEQKAIEWYKKAAEQGNCSAKQRLACHYEIYIDETSDNQLLRTKSTDDETSDDQLLRTKSTDDEASRYNEMGENYINEFSVSEMPYNEEMAIYCFKRAIELGSKKAAENLRKIREPHNRNLHVSNDSNKEASRYNEMGVEYWGQNEKEMALYCFRRAVELGSKEAEDNLRKAAGLGKLNEKQGRSANQILIEKYKVEMVKFVNDYNKQLFLTSSDVKLTVLPEDKKRLSKNNFDSWNEIKGVENICLIETRGAFSYQAKPLNLDDGNENEKNYYLVAPNRLTHNFTRKTVVEDAYLAFFCFTNNSVSERGARGRVVKPAIFQKVNGFYKLISKGEIELL